MNVKPELLYEDLQLGKEFDPFEMVVDTDTVDSFLSAIEENQDAIYQNQEIAKKWGYNQPLAPHGLAAIYARLSYLKNFTMPGGGILTKQEFRFFRPVFMGDKLVCTAKVVDRFLKKERKYVVFEINTCNQNGHPVSFVRIEVIWPK
jgi:3-hydroxybutyryl-CoA dehydratase